MVSLCKYHVLPDMGELVKDYCPSKQCPWWCKYAHRQGEVKCKKIEIKSLNWVDGGWGGDVGGGWKCGEVRREKWEVEK